MWLSPLIKTHFLKQITKLKIFLKQIKHHVFFLKRQLSIFLKIKLGGAMLGVVATPSGSLAAVAGPDRFGNYYQGCRMPDLTTGDNTIFKGFFFFFHFLSYKHISQFFYFYKTLFQKFYQTNFQLLSNVSPTKTILNFTLEISKAPVTLTIPMSLWSLYMDDNGIVKLVYHTI